MHVDQIWRYPVKSMAGEQLERTELLATGIPHDRSLYVVDELGRIVSARTRPHLLRHRATVDGHGNVLVDGLPWDAPEVTAAVERAAGPGARIVRASGAERFDVLPLLVATDGAIERFGHDPRRLRPNIVLAGVPGLAERTWERRQIRVGDAVVALDELRARCIITTLDPDGEGQDVEVLRRIREVFGGVLALNAWVGRPGQVGVGDPATLLEAAVTVEDPTYGRYAGHRRRERSPRRSRGHA